MSKILCLLSFCFLSLLFAQEAGKNSVIIIYSNDLGHTWQAENKTEAARDLISKIFHSYFVDPTKPIRKLSAEERKSYLPYVNSHLKDTPQKIGENLIGQLYAQLLFQKIFYNLKITLETTEPLSGLKLAYAQPYPDKEQKFPWATILEKSPVTKMDAGLQVSWRYVAQWENILVSSQDTKIPYYLYYESGKAPEQKEIALPVSSSQKGSIELTLSPKNFLVPNILLNTESKGTKEGEILGFLLQEKNSSLYNLLANILWKDILLKKEWAKEDFICDHFGAPEFTLEKTTPIVDTSKVSGPTEHFLAFETQLKHYNDLVKERDNLGLAFKGNNILLDYNPDDIGMLVSLPNLESDQRAYCWVMYPSNSRRWMEIAPGWKKGKHYFAQIFPPRGNKYNLAIQTARNKKVYINVPIGIPMEELPQYSKEPNDWSVPWKIEFKD